MVLNCSPECCMFFEMNLKVIIEDCPMDHQYAYWKPGSCYGALCRIMNPGVCTMRVYLLIMLNSVLRLKVKK